MICNKHKIVKVYEMYVVICKCDNGDKFVGKCVTSSSNFCEGVRTGLPWGPPPSKFVSHLLHTKNDWFVLCHVLCFYIQFNLGNNFSTLEHSSKSELTYNKNGDSDWQYLTAKLASLIYFFTFQMHSGLF